MNPSLPSYLESVRPKTTPHWTREKPKGQRILLAIHDR
jgi:hypothetical protein